MATVYIYSMTSLKNHSVYVGATSDPQRRFKSHVYLMYEPRGWGKKTPAQKAFRHHRAKDVQFEIHQKLDGVTHSGCREVNAIEAGWIEKLGAINRPRYSALSVIDRTSEAAPTRPNRDLASSRN